MSNIEYRSKETSSLLLVMIAQCIFFLRQSNYIVSDDRQSNSMRKHVCCQKKTVLRLYELCLLPFKQPNWQCNSVKQRNIRRSKFNVATTATCPNARFTDPNNGRKATVAPHTWVWGSFVGKALPFMKVSWFNLLFRMSYHSTLHLVFSYIQ